ncbi:MAG TPA: exodeoxyribonuclease VII small subunit, partial [Dehalococcoidia bacterium]|nr:exodeoxyribonuclease VII small subunit [Dehalococcoidia bacterium]
LIVRPGEARGRLMTMPASKSDQPSFEDLYKQLEEKVSMLEQGGLSLDDSLSTYEEAVGLAQKCQEMLDGAELRITRLRETIVPADAYVATPQEELSEIEEEDEVL